MTFMAPLYVQCNSERRAKPKHDMHHRMLKNPDYANTRTNMKGSRYGGRRGRKKGFFGRRRRLQKKGRQRASRKKSPISRMKRGEEREREARKVPLLPFLIHSFHAAARRRPLYAAVFLEDHSQVFSPLPTKKKLCKSHSLLQPTGENRSKSKFESRNEREFEHVKGLKGATLARGTAERIGVTHGMLEEDLARTFTT